jgi:hypothetical protein
MMKVTVEMIEHGHGSHQFDIDVDREGGHPPFDAEEVIRDAVWQHGAEMNKRSDSNYSEHGATWYSFAMNFRVPDKDEPKCGHEECVAHYNESLYTLSECIRDEEE